MKISRVAWPTIIAFTVSFAAAPARSDLITGLLAYYPFNGNAQDASGNGNHGVPNANCSLTSDRFGASNGAYLFNGTNSQITIPSSSSLASPSNQITMCAWISLSGNSKVGSPFWPLLMKSNTTENAFMYRVSGDLTGFGGAYNDWNTQQGAPYSFQLNTWTFVAVVWDGAVERYYVNGTQTGQTSRTLTITPDSRPLVIGADTPGVYESFWGKIDDVRIYGRALNPSEIQTLASQTTDVEDVAPATRLAMRVPSPNPARGPSHAELALREATTVQLTVCDTQGRRVRTLVSGLLPAGTHVVHWDGRDEIGQQVSPGIYFWRLHAPSGDISRRAVRLQ